ncbi:MAG: DnaD domain protein [Eubacteriales bacterium]
MKIRINYGEQVVALPGKVMSLMKDADAVALKVLLILASSSGEQTEVSALAAAAGCSSEDAEKALNFWRQAGIVFVDSKATAVTITAHQVDTAKVSIVHSGEMPSYTGKEIERLFEANGELRNFIDECQRLLGKLLSVSEINKLIGLVDYYRFSGDYVLLLVKRCVEIGKGSVPYIVRTAISMYNSGIVTIEALEDKIREEDEVLAMETTLRKLMGWGKRALTDKEKRFVKCWTEWQIPDDMLELVYQITVDATKGPSMPYMNKILTSWREAGYKTANDARAAMEQYKQKKAAATGGSSFNRDEFFEAAIRHSLEIHGKSEG